MIKYTSCMNTYLNTYKMITTNIKRKTPAPTAPIVTSRCGSAVCDSKSTKSKLFNIKQNEKSADYRIKSKKKMFPRTDYQNIKKKYYSFFFTQALWFNQFSVNSNFSTIIDRPDDFFKNTLK